ncbi:hypothetical protein Hokovirus_3_75 [Hokovirus HKV1]|uniref:Uncharacterized protein n=1 Tax=Hokovirus HKV1 TaxID=1977638 RepID=A0A1V0SGF8_9VIRU|nr:hypothetical protein Hokovirus_3_75 [Hokovirus HKV1]
MRYINFGEKPYLEAIRSAVEYYDNNTVKYNKLYKKMYNGSLIMENDEIFLKYVYKKKEQNIKLEYVGCFDIQVGLWVWSWANSGDKLSASNDGKIRKLLNYGLNIPTSNLLREHLINSRCIFNSNIQYDIHIALISYITKMPIILCFDNIRINEDKKKIILLDKNNVEYSGIIEVFIPVNCDDL